MAYCVNCGRKLADDYEFCPDCGQMVHLDTASAPFTNGQFNGDTIICSQCGAAMPADALYCLNCGNQFNNAAPPIDFEAIQKSVRKNAKFGRERRKKWIALLLCVLFGWLGAHRFYEGKIATGLIWLFTFGLFGIGWCCDIVYTAVMPSHRLWKNRKM